MKVDGTLMSRDSAYDQFVCRIWLTRVALWDLLLTSSYGIVLMALDRYVAVIYPVWYSTKVRDVLNICAGLTCCYNIEVLILLWRVSNTFQKY